MVGEWQSCAERLYVASCGVSVVREWLGLGICPPVKSTVPGWEDMYE